MSEKNNDDKQEEYSDKMDLDAQNIILENIELESSSENGMDIVIELEIESEPVLDSTKQHASDKKYIGILDTHAEEGTSRSIDDVDGGKQQATKTPDPVNPLPGCSSVPEVSLIPQKASVQLFAEDTGPQLYDAKCPLVTLPIITKNLPKVFEYLPIHGREIVMGTNVPVMGVVSGNIIHNLNEPPEINEDPNLCILKKHKIRVEKDTKGLFTKKLKYRGVRNLPFTQEMYHNMPAAKPTIEVPDVDLEPGRDVLYRVRVYRPYTYSMAKERFELFPSGFLFINNVFYVDTREGCVDYSEPIREWAIKKKLGKFPKKDMCSVKLEDLVLKLGYPEVYVHQGNCEHVFLFSEVRLLNPTDPLRLYNYPCSTAIAQNQTVYCTTCAEFSAKWIVVGCSRVPFDPAFFCETCFKQYLYKDGKKIGDFKAYSYRGNALNVLKP
ncbi:hypothetical protein HF086_014903 [Spodoptera exigua]|uniref:snRNA-activating protein complex subunit 3 n=1 Tax=Spodoptera exigua TaxID=7107 RepID=A0A922SGZ5_SPOEX|nr:hypothetical protein HF086_014903 [Spodoptera exigua]